MNGLKKFPLAVATLCVVFCLRIAGFATGQLLSVDFQRGQYFDEPFFSFTYAGKSSEELLRHWKPERSSRALDDQRTERRIVWTDPATGLQVRCVGIECQDFQVIEWTVYFKNTSQENTPIIQDIQAFDVIFQRSQDGEFVLHGTKGDWCTADSFEPFQQSESFVARAKAAGARHVQLLVRPGKGQGWGEFWKSEEDITAFADWFDHYLRAPSR